MGRCNFDLGDKTLNDAYDQLRSDYNAARQTRFQRRRAGVTSTGRGADYHYYSQRDYFYTMELSRDILRNDCIVGQGVRRMVNNVIQDGFALDAQTGDAAIDRELAARWKTWAEDADQCDLAGEHTFHAMEKLVLQAVTVDGDQLALPLREEGSLELVEAHRLRTPTNTTQNVVHGVLLGPGRRRLQYWFTKDDLSPLASVARVADVRKYDAREYDPITGRPERQVFHCYRPDRVSQTRGVTAFAPITDTAGYHDDLQFAQLVKAQVTACFAIFEEYPLGMPGGPPTRTGPRDLEALADGTTRATEGIAPGMRVRGAPGAKLSGFSPNVPIIEVLRLGQDEAVTSTGTTAESFTVDSDSSGAKLKLDTNSATGDFTLSVSPANLTAIRPSHPAPAGTAATLGSAARCRPSARPAGGTRGNGPRPGLYERR